MKDRFTTRLAPQQAMTLAAARAARRLVVTSGRVWVTLTGDVGDYWLAAGEGLVIEPGREAVVEAWPEATFQLLQAATVRRVRLDARLTLLPLASPAP